jgi:hypothetical protein
LAAGQVRSGSTGGQREREGEATLQDHKKVVTPVEILIQAQEPVIDDRAGTGNHGKVGRGLLATIDETPEVDAGGIPVVRDTEGVVKRRGERETRVGTFVVKKRGAQHQRGETKEAGVFQRSGRTTTGGRGNRGRVAEGATRA